MALVKQYASIVNDSYKETIGSKLSGTIDTSDVVTMGKTLDEYDGYDAFYGAITNKIVKTIGYVLHYKADGRKILKDAITYGAFIEKVYIDSIDAVDTPSWKVSQSNGIMSNISDPYGVTKTYTITSKIFGGRGTWSLEFNTDTHQIKTAFRSESALMAFIDSIFVKAQTDMEIEKESVVNNAINTGIATALHGGCVYNLLQRYNKIATTPLTNAQAQYDVDYHRWANMEMNRIIKLMAKPSKKFNPSKYLNASPRTNLILEVLDAWDSASSAMLESGTYHDDKVAISGEYETVPFWQINSDNYDTASMIDIKNIDLWNDGESTPTAIANKQNGIIAIARANDSVACLFDMEYSWSMPNPRARINSYGYDFEKGYAVEPHANFVVFVSDDGSQYFDTTNTPDTWDIVGDIAQGNRISVLPSKTGKTISKVQKKVGAGSYADISVSEDGRYYFDVQDGLKVKVTWAS